MNFAPIVRRVPANARGRDFIVGDIHGAFSLVDEALRLVGFDPEADRLFSVGDLIDRGPESSRCVEFLARPYVHAVRGNHEEILLLLHEDGDPAREVLEFYARRNGMAWWLETAPDVRQAVLEAIAALPVAIELQTRRGSVGLVHADVPDGMDWQTFCRRLEAEDEDVRQVALEGRDRIKSRCEDGVRGIGRVFVGHTPRWAGAQRLGNVYAIDTGAVFGTEGHPGHLTIANVCMRTEALVNPRRAVELIDVCDEPPRDARRPFGVYARLRR